MSKLLKGFFFSFLLFLLSACDEEYKTFPVQQEVMQDEFVFRLISEKDEYKKGEEIVVYGLLEYIGDASGKEIIQGSSVMSFDLEEKTKGVMSTGGIRGIAIPLFLTKGVPYQEFYKIKKELPIGEYTVTGTAEFSDATSDATIETKIDFSIK